MPLFVVCTWQFLHVQRMAISDRTHQACGQISEGDFIRHRTVQIVTNTSQASIRDRVTCSVRSGARGAPRKIPAPHRTAGRGGGSFFFHPAPCPVRGPALPGPRFCNFRGPFFASPRKFPIPGPCFLRGTVRGPANCSQFRAGKANFRRMLSNKHTPDR